MALLCVAGLLGLFGGGPFSSRHLSARDLELRYDGMVRMGTPQTLKLRVTPVHGAARIALATAYLDGVRLDGVLPAPEHVAASSEWTTFTFASSDGTPIQVAFTLVPDRFGVLDGKLRRESDPELAFRQIVYP